ncbi:amino acid ABC transporter permease [Marinovum algicola]|uniref:amino acid ABC transporter permease n=1 Tax=Marinovum algicola TaxID=42444 RepID=UPI0032EAC2D6
MDAILPRQTRLRALRTDYFSTRLDTLVTLGFGLLAAWVLWSLFDWGVLHAVWSAENREACGHGAEGACWAVIDARWRLILFGLYPFEEQWRSALACAVIVLTGGASCAPWFWTARRLAALWVAGFVTFYVLMRGGVFGLTEVSEQNWGGLSLTIFIFASVTLLGMPLAIVFALLRRSQLPWIARTMGVIIDAIRSLPLLSIMFTFAIVLPFVLPGWMIGDKLHRVIAGYALFFACYQAEIIRGGIQSLPGGQEEAAQALGLGYWHRIGHIILPQAFRNALPATINQLVITFKETSLVVIIGFFEILASGNAAYGNSEWNFAHVEVYAFVGLIYFVFVFALSRYGAYLERRMAVAER